MKHWLYSLIVLVALGGANLTALAHAKLVSSNPADGGRAASGLSALKLNFSKPMRLTLVNVTHADSKSGIEIAGPLPDGFVKSATVEVPALEPGSYRVRWTAVATDGHVMTGTVKFSIDAKPSQASP